MLTQRKYRNVFLSLICIASFLFVWIKLSSHIDVDNLFILLAVVYATSIVSALVLLFLRMIRYPSLQTDFFYTLTGTINILGGFIGLVRSTGIYEGRLYIASAAFVAGSFIYHDVFLKKA